MKCFTSPIAYPPEITHVGAFGHSFATGAGVQRSFSSALAFALMTITGGVEAVEDPLPAPCGCVAKYAACVRFHARPGQIGGAVNACAENLATCTDACEDKQAAHRDCRRARAAGNDACLEAFPLRLCATDDATCRARVVRYREECLRSVAETLPACAR